MLIIAKKLALYLCQGDALTATKSKEVAYISSLVTTPEIHTMKFVILLWIALVIQQAE